jgi:PKD repeat protein
MVSDGLETASAMMTITVGEDTGQFQMELGEVEINHDWVRVDFSDSFVNPVVVAGPVSSNDSDPCVIRLRNITSTGFDIRLQEWNYLDGSHALETVAYFVLERGSFTLADGTMVEAGQFDANNIAFQTVQFKTAFATEPVVIASVATYHEDDTVTGRLRKILPASFEYKMEEEELGGGHGNEVINYIGWESGSSAFGSVNVSVNRTADAVKNSWFTVVYDKQLNAVPIFLGDMQSYDGTDTSTIRYTGKTVSELKVKVEEEQSHDDETRHTTETIGYFLFSENSGEPGNLPPVAVISVDKSEGVAPLSITVDASQSTDENGSIVSWLWDFGGGETDNAKTASHVFSQAGSYPVTLTVTDGQGATGQAEILITVQEATAASYQFTAQINASSDDAEESPTLGVNLTSSDIELVTDPYDDSLQIIGLRFADITIPKGARITEAYIEFETDETGSSQTALVIGAEQAANAPTFTTEKNNISNRNLVSSSVNWIDIPSWDTVNMKHQTPDLSTVLQEVIDQNEWVEGNAVVFVITGTEGCRTAESYNGERAAAPVLQVVYQLTE